MLVFVYGTLMSGLSNHSVMRNPKFLGLAKTEKKFKLSCSGIPFLTTDEKISQIHGEIYELSSADVKACDYLEAHPNVYKRSLIDIITDEGETVKAYTYIYQRNLNNSIHVEKSGNYREYVKALLTNQV